MQKKQKKQKNIKTVINTNIMRTGIFSCAIAAVAAIALAMGGCSCEAKSVKSEGSSAIFGSAISSESSSGEAQTDWRIWKRFSRVEMTGVDTTVTFRIPNVYKSIDAGFAFDIKYTDEFEDITVVADKAFVPYLKVQLDDEELSLGLKVQNFHNARMVEVYVPISRYDLVEIDLSGACEFSTTRVLQGPKLEIDLSGASRARLAVDVEKLEVDCSGASKLSLAGWAAKASLDCSGASCVDADEFVAEQAYLDCSGASKMNIGCKKATGDCSGASRIKVPADAEINIDCSGASSIGKL